MGFHHQPNLVNDGLVLALDASDKNSFSGSLQGDVLNRWLDLSKNNIHMTVTSAPFFDTGSGFAGVDFDGSDDKMSVADNDLLSFGNGSSDFPFSVSVWANMDDVTDAKFGQKGHWNNNPEWGLRIDSADKFQLVLYDSPQTVLVRKSIQHFTMDIYQNKWTNFVGTYDGSGDPNNIHLYINGVQQSGSVLPNASYTAMHNLGSTFDLMIHDDDEFANGTLGTYHIHGKELSSSEVLHNYNVLKSRFGL